MIATAVTRKHKLDGSSMRNDEAAKESSYQPTKFQKIRQGNFFVEHLKQEYWKNSEHRQLEKPIITKLIGLGSDEFPGHYDREKKNYDAYSQRVKKAIFESQFDASFAKLNPYPVSKFSKLLHQPIIGSFSEREAFVTDKTVDGNTPKWGAHIDTVTRSILDLILSETMKSTLPPHRNHVNASVVVDLILVLLHLTCHGKDPNGKTISITENCVTGMVERFNATLGIPNHYDLFKRTTKIKGAGISGSREELMNDLNAKFSQQVPPKDYFEVYHDEFTLEKALGELSKHKYLVSCFPREEPFAHLFHNGESYMDGVPMNQVESELKHFEKVADHYHRHTNSPSTASLHRSSSDSSDDSSYYSSYYSSYDSSYYSSYDARSTSSYDARSTSSYDARSTSSYDARSTSSYDAYRCTPTASPSGGTDYSSPPEVVCQRGVPCSTPADDNGNCGIVLKARRDNVDHQLNTNACSPQEDLPLNRKLSLSADADDTHEMFHFAMGDELDEFDMVSFRQV